MQVWVFDMNGFFVETTEVEKIEENMTTIPIGNVAYIKPKWNGIAWEEGATAEEIEEWKQSQQIDICPKPTAEERIAQLEVDKEALAQNVYALAEVLEALLGGEEDGQEEPITEDTAG